MAEIVLFHTALGPHPGTVRDADRVRAAGHVVHLPDLYEGRVFTDADEGVAHSDVIGWPILVARAEAALAGLPAGIVVMGMSMGVSMATHVALTRPGVRGALLCFTGHPPATAWPRGVPAQVHHSVDDRWSAVGSTSALVAAVARAGAPASLHLYPGDRHLFTHEDLPDDYDGANAELFWARALKFLATFEP
jgi:dienelactone hydrolase